LTPNILHGSDQVFRATGTTFGDLVGKLVVLVVECSKQPHRALCVAPADRAALGDLRGLHFLSHPP